MPTTHVTDSLTFLTPASAIIADNAIPLPDWVNKDLNKAMSKEATAGLSQAAFADQKNRELPIHSKQAAFLSSLECLYRPHEISEDQEFRVKQAAERLGILEDVLPYVEVFESAYTKQASASETVVKKAFAIDTSDMQMLPINYAHEIESSAEDLESMLQSNRIPSTLAASAAVEIRKAASEAGVSIDMTDALAGLAAGKSADLDKAASIILSTRSGIVKDMGVYEDAIKCAKDGNCTAEELSIEIDRLDYSNKLGTLHKFAHQSAASTIPTAYEAVFTGVSEVDVEKAASTNVAVRGVVIPGTAVDNIDVESLDFDLSKEASEKIVPLLESKNYGALTMALLDSDEVTQKAFLRASVSANS